MSKTSNMSIIYNAIIRSYINGLLSDVKIFINSLFLINLIFKKKPDQIQIIENPIRQKSDPNRSDFLTKQNGSRLKWSGPNLIWIVFLRTQYYINWNSKNFRFEENIAHKKIRLKLHFILIHKFKEINF